MRIALTGATGLLGRNLLFEFIKRHRDRLDSLEVIALGRGADGLSFRQRLIEICHDDAPWYVCGGPTLDQDIVDFLRDRVSTVEFDLSSGLLEPSAHEVLRREPIDYFFHVAAMLDFRDSPAVARALERANVKGTEILLSLVSTLTVREFAYVGSAYECGIVPEGTRSISAGDLDVERPFRNPYELGKARAEMLVREFERTHNVRCRYFRPSTLCGRLIEPPLGRLPKFDVFYAWGAFFLRYKLKFIDSFEERYTKPVELDMRIRYRTDTGLNIVPADYVAKAMYLICTSGAPGSHFHLANAAETPSTMVGSMMRATLNITGHRQCDDLPIDQNPHESVYYRTVGKIYTPYVIGEPMLFDVSNVESVLRDAQLTCPPVDATNFGKLMDYAKERDFGISA